MPNLETTLKEIKRHKPYGLKPGSNYGWSKLTTNLKRKKGPVTLQKILDSNGVADSYWALRCWPVETYAIVRARVAESVYHIWLEENPEDTTVRACVDGWYNLATGNINTYQMKLLRKAADAYPSAMYATASYAADAAICSAAIVAICSAAIAAIASSSPNIALEKQWAKNKEILEEFICQI